MEDYDFFKKKISDIGVFKELQCFQLLFNDEIVGLLVEESNNYYRKILIEKYGNLPIVFSGGVSSNSLLQKHFKEKYNTVFASPEFSCDNAAGIAYLTYLKNSRD